MQEFAAKKIIFLTLICLYQRSSGNEVVVVEGRQRGRSLTSQCQGIAPVTVCFFGMAPVDLGMFERRGFRTLILILLGAVVGEVPRDSQSDVILVFFMSQ